MNDKLPNLQWNVVRTWAILGIVFLAACFLPAALDIDGMNGGYAIITLCGFLVVVSLVVLAFFIPRARRLDKMLNQGEYLARWDIEPALWKEFVSYDFNADNRISRGTFKLVSIITVIIGVLLTLVTRDLLMAVICLGIIVLLIIPAFAFPWFRKRKKLRNPPLVVFSSESVYVGGTYFNWNMAGSRLDSAIIEQVESLTIMKLVMSYPARTGIESWEIRLPVPPGKLHDAQQICAQYGY